MKIYQIFVDRFSTDNAHKDARLAFKTSKTWMGGNLKGVISKLGYIKDMSFDAIWLTPIFSTSDYHGYSTTDFYSVDRHFGSNNTLKKLVDTAHSIGLKVILDFVANHVSYKHPFFVSALKNGKSRYKKWFVFDGKDNYMSFLGFKGLPKLNTKNKEVIDYLTEAGLFWINNFGIDGYRLDHAIGPSMEFWKVFTEACKKVDRNFAFLPEIWLSGIAPKYLNTLWFLEDETKKNALLELVNKNIGKAWDEIQSAKAEEFAMELFSRLFKTPLDFSSNLAIRRLKFDMLEKRRKKGFIFADNHDMQRISWLIPDKTNSVVRELGKAQNSIVYYGTEIGLSQKRDFSRLASFSDIECRRFMAWKKDNISKVKKFKYNFLGNQL
ncbi:alpha-amylase family glycosyl hydrolase [Candidatus Parvarchaeota archaeon]|jgi:glycosidase|nr:alpha-amylase family glycosyl hydrolase [Candidatus Parvarchaeota archaeon]